MKKKKLIRIKANLNTYLSILSIGLILPVLLYVLLKYVFCDNGNYFKDILVGSVASILASCIFLINEKYSGFNRMCNSVTHKITKLLETVKYYPPDEQKVIYNKDCILFRGVIENTYDEICYLSSLHHYTEHLSEVKKCLFEINKSLTENKCRDITHLLKKLDSENTKI